MKNNREIDDLVARTEPIVSPGFSRRGFSTSVAKIVLGFTLAASPVLAGAQGAQIQSTEQLLKQGTYHGYVLLTKISSECAFETTGYESMKKELGDFFKSWKPGIEKDKVGFEIFTSEMARDGQKYGGALSQNTFNRYVEYYTTYVQIAHEIDKLKMNKDFSKTLKELYINAIFYRRKPSLYEVQKKYSAVVNGATYFSVTKGILKISDNIEPYLLKCFPEFNNLPDLEKKKVMDYLTDINPRLIYIGGVRIKNDSASSLGLSLNTDYSMGVKVNENIYYYSFFSRMDESSKSYTLIIPHQNILLQKAGAQ